MTRVLFDTNVALDVLIDRPPFAEPSALAWAAVESGRAEGYLAAHGVTTIHYFVQKHVGIAQAKKAMVQILRIFNVAAVNSAVLQSALHISASDFEDAVTASAAAAAHCDFIVTRDPKGFRGSPIRPLTPEAILPILSRYIS